MSDTDETETWFTITEDELRRILREAHRGDDPDLILLELFANADEGEPDD